MCLARVLEDGRRVRMLITDDPTRDFSSNESRLTCSTSTISTLSLSPLARFR